MVVIFYADPVSPPCNGVHMTLEALKIQYKKEDILILTGKQKSEEYLKINPRGKVPAIVDESLIVTESRAIACYLCNKYATDSNQSLYPREPEARAKVDVMLFASEWIWNDILEGYVNETEVLHKGKQPLYENEYKVDGVLKYIENALKTSKFVAGNNITIADFFLEGAVGFLNVLDFDRFGDYPKVQEWIKRIKSIEYYAKCNSVESFNQFKTFFNSKIASK